MESKCIIDLKLPRFFPHRIGKVKKRDNLKKTYLLILIDSIESFLFCVSSSNVEFSKALILPHETADLIHFVVNLSHFPDMLQSATK